MKKNYFFIILLIVLGSAGCKNTVDSYLNKKPTDILLSDQLWSDPSLVLSNLASLYDRVPEYQELDQYGNFADFDLAFPSAYGDYWRVQNQYYDYNNWQNWDYDYVRAINLFVQKDRLADKLDNSDKIRFLGEAQFLRANAYFDLVKRMGGVPLLLDTLQYDFNGDVASLQHARDPEASVYDFVISEFDSAANNLPKDPSIKARATWGAAMAMKSRAALYAASIAKYGATTPSVSLPNGIVGIPASKADHYYQIALDAAQKVINSNEYSLYMRYPNDLQKNFAQLFVDKNNNPEVIWVKDYKLKSRNEQFTVGNQPHSLTEDAATGGFLNPSLNLAESFEKLDNTFGPFKTDSAGNYVKYDNVGDIFKGRDARLGGTIMLPGSTFRGSSLDIWAGYILPQANDSIITGSDFGQQKVLPGQSVPSQVVGFDGPIDELEHSAQTGFYIRKFMDPTPGAGDIGTGSNVWWIRMRYAEVLLNAAESAFELGQKDLAAQYLNEVRARAGLTTPLTPDQVTFDRIVYNRKAEFAFEGQYFWDMKRWRLADKVWNGGTTDLTTLPGKADAPSTEMYGLWPYKIYDPGKSDNGKWIFKIVKPSAVTNAHQFRLGNYYSRIPDNVMANNPKLIQNPDQQ
ncbi:MAG TPA: RagB/SusD family nutrient uptake outer membrane protein [Balneolales bacterium]|nr:RagB/SusD family nutrient uptake outer membrane protein [Balneolales bacterium]